MEVKESLCRTLRAHSNIDKYGTFQRAMGLAGSASLGLQRCWGKIEGKRIKV